MYIQYIESYIKTCLINMLNVKFSCEIKKKWIFLANHNGLLTIIFNVGC